MSSVSSCYYGLRGMQTLVLDYSLGRLMRFVFCLSSRSGGIMRFVSCLSSESEGYEICCLFFLFGVGRGHEICPLPLVDASGSEGM